MRKDGKGQLLDKLSRSTLCLQRLVMQNAKQSNAPRSTASLGEKSKTGHGSSPFLAKPTDRPKSAKAESSASPPTLPTFLHLFQRNSSPYLQSHLRPPHHRSNASRCDRTHSSDSAVSSRAWDCRHGQRRGYFGCLLPRPVLQTPHPSAMPGQKRHPRRPVWAAPPARSSTCGCCSSHSSSPSSDSHCPTTWIQKSVPLAPVPLPFA